MKIIDCSGNHLYQDHLCLAPKFRENRSRATLSYCMYVCLCIYIYIYIYICILIFRGYLGKPRDPATLYAQSAYYILYVTICVYIYIYNMYVLIPTAIPDEVSRERAGVGFSGFDSSKLLILRGGNSHVHMIVQGVSRNV